MSEHGTVQGAGEYLLGEVATLSLSSTVHQTGHGVRYVFTGWVDEQGNILSTQSTIQVKLDKEHVIIHAKWREEYLVGVESPFGRVSGGGWYPRGGIAHISLDRAEFVQDDTRYRFVEWKDQQGNSISTDLSLEIEVKGPIKLKAVWASEPVKFPILEFLTNPFIAAAILLLVFFLIDVRVLKRLKLT